MTKLPDDPFGDLSDQWAKYRPRDRRRILDALQRLEATWHKFEVRPTVTPADVARFARRALLQSFFSLSSQLTVAVAWRRAGESTQVWLATTRTPAGMKWPCWACGMDYVMRITFGDDCTRVRPADANEPGHRE